MDRREMLGALGAGAAGLAAMGGAAAFAQGQAQAHQGHEGHEGHAGHQIMDECARVCNETAAHCLQLAGKAGGQGQDVHLKVHVATMDCQAFCHLASALAARNSPMAAYAHQACADACRDCAAACDAGQDEVMKRCAEVCRRCEQHCRQQGQGRAGATR